MTDVVRLSFFVKNIQDVDAIDIVFARFFPTYKPARTIVVVDALPVAGALLQIDTLITHGEGTIPNAPQAGDLIKLTNQTTQAPVDPLASQTVAFSHYNNLSAQLPIERYSTQTVAFSHYNHLSAQLPVDAQTGELVATDIKTQAIQCFTHLQSIVESIDHQLADTVKVNIYVKDLAEMAIVDEVYANFFPTNPPARRIVGVANLPKEARIQVDAIIGNAEGTPVKSKSL